MFSPLTSILDIATFRTPAASDYSNWNDRDLFAIGLTRADVTKTAKRKR
jgi:hypothetical protein